MINPITRQLQNLDDVAPKAISPTLVIILLFLITAPQNLPAQHQAITGTVLNAQTGKAIPLASVAVRSEDAGTYTNDDGQYELSVSPTDTLVFSALGYTPRVVPITALNGPLHLRPRPYDLPVINQTAARAKEKIVRLGFQERKIRGGMIPLPGYQFARFIPNPDGTEGILGAATFQFPKGLPGINSGGRFRVRVFARKPGMNTFHPGDDLLLESVKFLTTRKGGSVSINLRKHGIVFPPEGLFIGLEYLGKADGSPARKDGRTTGPVLGKYTTTNGEALTFARFRDNFWSRRNLPRWTEEEVPNMAFGAVVIFFY